MVVGEAYGCVKSFCYLGDTLDGDGGADRAATARIRNGWMKFYFGHLKLPRWRCTNECMPVVRSSMTYGSALAS